MWASFPADLVITVLGALLTAVITVLLAFVTYKREQRRRETAALWRLFDDVRRRRVFQVPAAPTNIAKASKTDDYKRCSKSIIALREVVTQTRLEMRFRSDALGPLSQMIFACNEYLESAAREPRRYVFQLVTLKAAISKSIVALADLDSRLMAIVPGAGAFTQAQSDGT